MRKKEQQRPKIWISKKELENWKALQKEVISRHFEKLNQKQMEKVNDEVNQIVINKEASFVEVWHEGYVECKGERHYFWLIDPQGVDPRGNEYAPEVRWFFARVPMEVRVMYNSIIEAFKQTQK
jgi:hypothetical protein